MLLRGLVCFGGELVLICRVGLIVAYKGFDLTGTKAQVGKGSDVAGTGAVRSPPPKKKAHNLLNTHLLNSGWSAVLLFLMHIYAPTH